MICNPCKAQDHEECPSKKAGGEWMPDPDAPGTQILKVKRPSMALSEEGVAIQLSGLCPCQHKVKAPPAGEEDFHDAIHHVNQQFALAGVTPIPCPMCEPQKETTCGWIAAR